MELPKPDQVVLSRKPAIVARLASVLPDGCVIDAEDELRAYECDALTAYRCPPMAVVLPETTEQVAAVLAVCHELNVPVVPRGAGTSLAGGAMPTSDSVILGTARMNAVLETDYANRFIRVQTGRTNLSVTGAVEENGFFYAPDPSSQLACAIAGNIAMNSGGAHCLKYGVTTNNLLGVTLVTMDGEVIKVGGAHMDAGGLDLLGVICGSEGQLGVVTEATLRILPKPEGARPVLIGFDDNEVAGACVSDIIQAGVLPVAIEFMDRPCIRATEAFAGAGYPDCEALLIIEVEGSETEIDDQLARIVAIAAKHTPVEVRQSSSAEESAKIWLGRKSAFGAMGQINDYMCLDGTIPVSQLPLVLRRIRELSEDFGLDVGNVFHAGDGNMHPLILFDANKPGDLEKCEALGAEILKLCVDVGGCLTGEHGVGIEKRDLMGHQYTEADLEAQMAVKDVFDPKWLLNAAKVFPLEVSAARRGQWGGLPSGPTAHSPQGILSKKKMKPETEDELSECVAGAGGALAVRGGGTRGVSCAGEVLDVSGLSGVSLYEPGALTLVARAGTPLAEVEALLASEGQRLAFEPSDNRGLLGIDGMPTLGGLVAGNISGPRRVAVGACRDFLLGVRFVNGLGQVISNGGRVMKNVTGYDLVKLMAGSWGSLGVLSEVSMKVMPVPEMAACVLINGLSDEKALVAMSRALGSPYDVTGAAHAPAGVDGHPVTMLRLEGFEASVSYRAAQLKDMLAGSGEVLIETDQARLRAGWQWVRDVELFHGRDGDIWQVSVKPSDAPALVAAVGPKANLYDWGGGLIWMLCEAGTDVRASMTGMGGHATMVRGDGFARFHPEPAGVARLSAGVRAKFDPRGILNAGVMG